MRLRSKTTTSAAHDGRAPGEPLPRAPSASMAPAGSGPHSQASCMGAVPSSTSGTPFSSATSPPHNQATSASALHQVYNYMAPGTPQPPTSSSSAGFVPVSLFHPAASSAPALPPTMPASTVLPVMPPQPHWLSPQQGMYQYAPPPSPYHAVHVPTQAGTGSVLPPPVTPSVAAPPPPISPAVAASTAHDDLRRELEDLRAGLARLRAERDARPRVPDRATPADAALLSILQAPLRRDAHLAPPDPATVDAYVRTLAHGGDEIRRFKEEDMKGLFTDLDPSKAEAWSKQFAARVGTRSRALRAFFALVELAGRSFALQAAMAEPTFDEPSAFLLDSLHLVLTRGTPRVELTFALQHQLPEILSSGVHLYFAALSRARYQPSELAAARDALKSSVVLRADMDYATASVALTTFMTSWESLIGDTGTLHERVYGLQTLLIDKIPAVHMQERTRLVGLLNQAEMRGLTPGSIDAPDLEPAALISVIAGYVGRHATPSLVGLSADAHGDGGPPGGRAEGPCTNCGDPHAWSACTAQPCSTCAFQFCTTVSGRHRTCPAAWQQQPKPEQLKTAGGGAMHASCVRKLQAKWRDLHPRVGRTADGVSGNGDGDASGSPPASAPAPAPTPVPASLAPVGQSAAALLMPIARCAVSPFGAELGRHA